MSLPPAENNRTGIWPDNPLRWFPEFLKFRRRQVRSQVRLLGSSLLVGIVAGIGAILFYVATQAATEYVVGQFVGYDPAVHPAGEPALSWIAPPRHGLRPLLLLAVITTGGLLSGLFVYTFAPEAEGHGTDSVIAAYHQQQGLIRPRVPVIKMLASVLTLGSGGSGGREGPIAQIAAGFGSYLAVLLRFSPAERRVLMAAGMGAGIAAIFRAPLAGALFAAEVLYSSPEFEPEVILPAALASVVSYCTFASVFGWQPLFAIPAGLAFHSPWELAPYTLLALLVVILAMLYTRTFYTVTDLFRRSEIPRTLRPAVGAVLTGMVALLVYFALGRNPDALAVLSFGYGVLQQALTQDSLNAAALLMVLALGKIVTTSLTIGSGGSAGVFGPSMVIGGCGGGALGVVLHGVFPNLAPHPASYVVVGMAGFFAAAAKTPFSTLIIVSEMTGGYPLLLPTLWVCVLSFMLSDEQSIYSSQVEGRAQSPAHRGFLLRKVLGGSLVRQFVPLDAQVPVLSPRDSLRAAVERIDESGLPVVPVVDDQQRLLGVVALDDLHLAVRLPDTGRVALTADVMRDAAPLVPDDELDQAMELFVAEDLLALPVVNDRSQRRLIGMARRSTIARGYLSQIRGID